MEPSPNPRSSAPSTDTTDLQQEINILGQTETSSSPERQAATAASPGPPILDPEPGTEEQALGELYNPSSISGSLTQLPDAQMSRHQSSSRSESSRNPSIQLLTPESARNPRRMSQNDKEQLINSLRTHRVNTITELRRIEKIFAYLDSSEVTEPMTAAWAHYVNSNNLLNELRGLTKNYPFSSECLDEAKALVVRDPNSVRSWNYCWLVLQKIDREKLIAKHARALAAKSATWGGRTPTPEAVQRLVNVCVTEWNKALSQLLRHWDRAPSTTGN